ncbi:MAG: CDP-diacylglycerol--serine O-phosphatidyltransferase [Bacteroidia bacterium]|nr:CDP-diacylglycerol--serine O-phosphatidyltransferase [Bacteroidia bacterium]MDW8302175.1 CDP-diacylglycerol--serine O-phosphatidyltransferase [Bacteroidia bacterium]
MRRILPSFITILNACCGLTAIYVNHPIYSSILILLGSICDVFDGLAARWLQSQSEIGKQLDSLSDVITFGLAPSYLMYHHIFVYSRDSLYLSLLSCIILSIFAIIRLATFNVDTRQKDVFIGLPTPAMALFFIGLVAHYYYQNEWLTEINVMRFLLILPFLFAVMMILPIPMLSFKTVNVYWIPIILATPIFLYAFGWAGLSSTIIGYILVSSVKFILDRYTSNAQ